MTTATGTRSPRARALSAALRKAREDAGMTNRELAARLSLDQSHLSRIETGKRTPSIETTAMIVATLRTARDERDRILDLARNASEPNWLTVGTPGIPHQLAAAWECEHAASRITTWHHALIPGLLQTADYARSILTASTRLNPLSDNDIESRVMVKVSRREVLVGRDPVPFTALVSEVALREPVGSPAVMAEQLRRLISLSAEPNISIRVVPQRIGWHPGLPGSFMLYEFDDTPDVVYFEHHSSGAFNQDREDADEYRKAISDIGRLSMSEQESRDFVARLMVDEWSGDDVRSVAESESFQRER